MPIIPAFAASQLAPATAGGQRLVLLAVGAMLAPS
jgi:hypothetical protein